MGIIERRRLLLSAGEPPIPTIGGLVVYADNCYMTGGNGKIDDVLLNNDFFITGIFDTMSPDGKDYEITRWGTDVPAVIRFFNDIEANSIDYWTIMRTDITPGVPNIYRFNSSGRYVAISVVKHCAADFYFKYYNGDYICKGDNVV